MVAGLRVRLFLITLSVMLPVWGLTLYTGLRLREHEVNHAREELHRFAQIVAREQEEIIKITQHLLMALARLPEVRGQDSVACSNLLAIILKDFSFYLNFGVTDLNGEIICSALPFQQPVNAADRPWFQKVLATHAFAIGVYQIGRITGKSSINFGYPIRDSAGGLAKVLFAAVGLDWFVQILTKIGLHEEAALLLLDSHDTVFVRHPPLPDPGWIGKSIRETPLGESFSAPSKDELRELVGLDGVSRLHAIAPLSNDLGRVVLSLPSASVFATTNNLLIVSLLALGALTVLALAITYSVGTVLILRPINALKRAALQWTEGVWATRVEISKRQNEMGELAQSLNTMADALEQHEQERQEIEKDRLARALAERASQAKSEILARTSHELLTPLNAVLGFAQLLEMSALTNKQQENVRHILRSGRHLVELVHEALLTAQMGDESLQLSLEPVQAGEIVREVLELLGPQKSPKIKTISGAADQLYLLADRRRLKQALLNLLSNAMKFSRRWNDRVTISCEVQPEQRLRISVEDTGPGIPPEKLHRLFTPYDRLDVAATGVQGMDLGLPLAKRFLEAMGGTIGVRSTVGQGSTFWIELPLVEAPEAHKDTVAREERL